MFNASSLTEPSEGHKPCISLSMSFSTNVLPSFICFLASSGWVKRDGNLIFGEQTEAIFVSISKGRMG